VLIEQITQPGEHRTTPVALGGGFPTHLCRKTSPVVGRLPPRREQRPRALQDDSV
jgi:hypothetical protein